jgi:hypothetical protein
MLFISFVLDKFIKKNIILNKKMTDDKYFSKSEITDAIVSKYNSSKDVGHTHGGKCWGHGGAGLMLLSPNNEAIMLLYRSEHVMDPELWGIAGGARREDANGNLEDALVAALSESMDEMGGLPEGKIRREPYIFHKPETNFTYQTFFMDVDSSEFPRYQPKLNWEHTDAGWFDRAFVLGQMSPYHVHPGVLEVLKKYDFEQKKD